MELSDGVIAKDEVLIETAFEDLFVVKYETRNFPKFITSVEIYDTDHHKLGSYNIRDDFKEPRFPILFDQPDLRIYQIPEGIIYKGNEGRFRGVQSSRLKGEAFNENPELVKVAKALIETKE